jgi:hypothetical protein
MLHIVVTWKVVPEDPKGLRSQAVRNKIGSSRNLKKNWEVGNE